ncbi:uncharacterized protein [Gossypium hirsutum]|uniref:Uncharacterized protein n=1 Tax=Gossypium hirsutum TaxID=3635 RepID=A0A1U8L4P5_GOSHI|nr:uncharacterized protein LOC107922503 [Gossypium hirsutum]
MAHLDVVGNFSGPPQRRYGPYANTYNPRWKDHPSLSNGANPRGRELKPIPDRNLGQDSAQEKHENDEQARTKPQLHKIQPSFLGWLNQHRKGKDDKEILETFRNVEINIPLLDAIKPIPRYAKFLNELCTNKEKLTGNENVSVGENVSAVLQRKMPAKCKDRGMFAIPCKIGHLGIKKAMYDLGVSINVMHFSIYESLNASFLMKKSVIIQLADRSIVHPKGVLKDVLVKVNGLIFPTDFYVVKMEKDNTLRSSNILLARPFLSTVSTKIDMCSGTLTIEFDGEIMKFNIYGAISHPSKILNVNHVDIIDSLVGETFESPYEDKPKMIFDDFESVNELLSPMNTKLLPSIMQAPDLELKSLLEHIKYAFLEKDNTLPIIVSNRLSKLEKESLIHVLKNHKEAIGWTIADLKEINPLTCTYKIYLEENTKRKREAQI